MAHQNCSRLGQGAQDLCSLVGHSLDADALGTGCGIRGGRSLWLRAILERAGSTSCSRENKHSRTTYVTQHCAKMFYALTELIIWMVELKKYVNDSGSRQREIQSSGDLQMEGVIVEVQVSHLLVGSI